MEKRNGTKARPTLRKANIKSCSSMSGNWSTWLNDMSFEGLGQSWHFQLPWVFLAASLWSYLYTLPLRDCLRGSRHWHTLTGLTGLPLKAGLKPSWPPNSFILHYFKTKIMWMCPRSATSSGSSQIALDHSCRSLWMPDGLNTWEHFLRWALCNQAPRISLLKAKSFKWIKTFIALRLHWVGSG
jgi:hypothetical protein